MPARHAILCLCLLPLLLSAQLACPELNIHGDMVYPKLPQDAFYKKIYVKPEPYDSLPESEIVMARHIIKSIDLKEKGNKSLFNNYDRKLGVFPLFEVIKYGVVNNKLKIFKENKYTEPYSRMDSCVGFLQCIIHADSVEEISIDEKGAEKHEVVFRSDTLKYSDIKAFRLDEVWYFNKKWARLEKRIIGLAPVWQNPENGKEEELFWIYYNEARDLFASFAVNSTATELKWKTYDQIFMFRFFNCYIKKEFNVYDRDKLENGKALDALMESERTKEKIVNSDEDMWSH